MKRHIRAGLVCGMLLAGSIAQAAVQIDESEPNDPIERAQKIDKMSCLSSEMTTR